MGARRAAWPVATRGPSCRSAVLDRRHPAGRRPPACARRRRLSLGSMVFDLIPPARASPRLNSPTIVYTILVDTSIAGRWRDTQIEHQASRLQQREAPTAYASRVATL